MGLSVRTKQKLKLYVAVIGALFAMGMSIASFISAHKSYNVLLEIKGDYEIHINHWESQPLIDIQIVGAEDDCPWSYELAQVSNDRNALQTIGRFPGSKAWCDCQDGGFTWTYIYTQYWCDCGSGKTYNGTTYYTTSHGSGSCSSDASDAGCFTADRLATATEIWITSEGDCHSNASAAGCAKDDAVPSVSLTVWKNHKLCFQRGGWSALERVGALDIRESSCRKGVLCQQAHDTQDPSNTICAATVDECPLVHIGNISFLDSTNESYPEFNKSYNMDATNDDTDYLPIVEIRQTIGSPCWKGSFGQDGRSNNERVSSKYDSVCTVDDTRFIEWDTYDEPSLYNENGVETGGYNYMHGNGEYSEVQYYNESFDVEWKLSFRRQIFWSSDCEVGDISDLAWHLKPLKKVVDFQYALLVINGIFGLGILGVFIPVMMLMHACDKGHDLPCIPGEGQQERDNLNKIQKVLSLVSKVAKMIPLVLCLVVTDAIHWFFTSAGDAHCSDELTNAAMIVLGTEIDGVKKSNYTTLYLDIIMICWYIVPFLLWIYKKKIKGEDSKSRKESRNEGIALNTAHPVPHVQTNVVEYTAPNQAHHIVVSQAPGQPIPQIVQQPVIQPMFVQQPQQAIRAQPMFVQQMPPGIVYQPQQQPPLYVQPSAVQPQLIQAQPQQFAYQPQPQQFAYQPQPQQFVYQLPSAPDQTAAAIKLQAAWRGHKVRKNMNTEGQDAMSQFYYS